MADGPHQAGAIGSGAPRPDRAPGPAGTRFSQRLLGTGRGGGVDRLTWTPEHWVAAVLDHAAKLVIRDLSYNGRMAPVSVRRVSADGKPLTVRVDVNLDRRLQAAASREGLSVSD